MPGLLFTKTQSGFGILEMLVGVALLGVMVAGFLAVFDLVSGQVIGFNRSVNRTQELGALRVWLDSQDNCKAAFSQVVVPLGQSVTWKTPNLPLALKVQGPEIYAVSIDRTGNWGKLATLTVEYGDNIAMKIPIMLEVDAGATITDCSTRILKQGQEMSCPPTTL